MGTLHLSSDEVRMYLLQGDNGLIGIFFEFRGEGVLENNQTDKECAHLETNFLIFPTRILCAWKNPERNVLRVSPEKV